MSRAQRGRNHSWFAEVSGPRCQRGLHGTIVPVFGRSVLHRIRDTTPNQRGPIFQRPWLWAPACAGATSAIVAPRLAHSVPAKPAWVITLPQRTVSDSMNRLSSS